jgi:hypothetical protein
MPTTVAGLELPVFYVIRLCAHLTFVYVGGHKPSWIFKLFHAFASAQSRSPCNILNTQFVRVILHYLIFSRRPQSDWGYQRGEPKSQEGGVGGHIYRRHPGNSN